MSLEQAQTLAKSVESENFPLPVNDAVLESINFYIGTEEGRTKMKDSLERMETYKPLLEKKLKEYALPDDLLAIPIVESGYKNLPDKNTKGWGAGLWMFIRETARNYGLRVDKTVDERMNEELLTDAAMRYLNANMLRFKNWHLSLLAYNGGEGAVQRLINKTKSRNPWDLVKVGAESDKGYLSKVIAAAIIIKNPQLVQ
jgi:membrane-bound lytic murein transglycosylase D